MEAAVPGPAEIRMRIAVRGAVQGVGFRPFVYRLALDLGVAGFVANTAGGVEIEVEGAPDRVDGFHEALLLRKPALALIEAIETALLSPCGETGFRIRESAHDGEVRAFVLPDIAACPECLAEIHDLAQRRYRYAFTNCTNCGPRFSIIESIPYDRCNTSMKAFAMCADCAREYNDPADRRFHAQPIACPACGPKLALWDPEGEPIPLSGDMFAKCADMFRSGMIGAVKGLGGFHLMCMARNGLAVVELRKRKHREAKPFALMYPSLECIREDCHISPLEERLLTSPEAPIVLLRKRADLGSWANGAAPDNAYLGVMLPSTPLHHSLIEAVGAPLIATSGNLSEEPICIDEGEAMRRLGVVADFFLVHDRPIVRHVDDSIVREMRGQAMVLRRARGYAPLPVSVGEEGPAVLALGGHLKNTVAVSRGQNVFLSQHIGDLGTQLAFDAFTRAADDMQALFETSRSLVVCDGHPDYLSSQHALRIEAAPVAVQHHYAHVLACMAEHALAGPVLGVAWDGTGYGDDGTPWGGEFLVATRDGYERVGHLRSFGLPGGERAALEPRLSAAGLIAEMFARDGGLALRFRSRPGNEDLSVDWVLEQLFRAGDGDWEELHVRELDALVSGRGQTFPRTTSAGRLFDGAAALLGMFERNSFEGQAAMALEHCASQSEGGGKHFDGVAVLREEEGRTVLDWGPVITGLIAHGPASAPRSVAGRLFRDPQPVSMPSTDIAWSFHVAMAEGILAMARRIGLQEVVLSGGCFQNKLLTETAANLLETDGFRVYTHRLAPPNDGGIALGQAVYGIRYARRRAKGDRPCA